MKHWVFTCFIEDALGNVIMKQSFLKRWQAGKWGMKQIIKRGKFEEWCYEIIQTSEDD